MLDLKIWAFIYIEHNGLLLFIMLEILTLDLKTRVFMVGSVSVEFGFELDYLTRSLQIIFAPSDPYKLCHSFILSKYVH